MNQGRNQEENKQFLKQMTMETQRAKMYKIQQMEY
jgi:hypothetical protein